MSRSCCATSNSTKHDISVHILGFKSISTFPSFFPPNPCNFNDKLPLSCCWFWHWFWSSGFPVVIGWLVKESLNLQDKFWAINTISMGFGSLPSWISRFLCFHIAHKVVKIPCMYLIASSSFILLGNLNPGW